VFLCSEPTAQTNEQGDYTGCDIWLNRFPERLGLRMPVGFRLNALLNPALDIG
jgi:hypothetical protein